MEKEFIQEGMANTLVPKGCTIPRLYGLPKVHKTGTPLRPILSMVGSPYHKLAKFLANALKPVEQHYCKYSITDSFDLVSKLNKLGNHINANSHVKEFCLGSLDITSLFTSVPVDRCIDIIAQVVYSNEVNISFDVPTITQLLQICVKNIQFIFNNKYYIQKDGVAMGSPLGPILANIYVGYIESLNPHIDNDTFFFGRYVDDILVIAENAQVINQLKDSLNNVDRDIQFTTEFETNHSIPFLDVNIHRVGTELKFSWYHKHTWTGNLLHYASFVPMSWKTGLLKGYKTRVSRLCSPEYLDLAIDELADTFKNNGYPEPLIRSCFVDYLPDSRPVKTYTSPHHTDPRKPVFMYLPFYGDDLSKQLTSRINHYVQSAYSAARVIIRWQPSKAVHTSTKDSLPSLSVPNVVYHFQCACERENYVGRTELPLGDRIRQHLPKWLLQGKKQRPRSDRQPNSAITRHALCCVANNGDNNLVSCFKIIHKAKNAFLLKILEALEIKRRKPTLCVQKEDLFELKIPWF